MRAALSLKTAAALVLLALAADAGELARRGERTLRRVLDGGPPRYDLELLIADLIRNRAGGSPSSAEISPAATWKRWPRPGSPTARGLWRCALELQRPDGGFAAPLSSRLAGQP